MLAPGATAHVLFAHVEKTGGSSVECSSQIWGESGWWTNMGHTTARNLQACEARCKASNVSTAVVVGVRDPYKYWASVYRYAWIGSASAVTAWCEYFE